MCGIIGYHGPRTPDALRWIEEMILEASRRGTHATGLAYLEDGELCICNEPLPAKEFLDHYDLRGIAPNEKKLSFVAHTRYSTSDLDWNQPLEDEECALVMNGVISQDEPDNWPVSIYEYEPYRTRNDVEVALRFAKLGQRGEMPGSFAILELWQDGKMYAYRNAHRPLYWTSAQGGDFFFASTEDIITRVLGPQRTPSMLAPGMVHDCVRTGVVSEFAVEAERQDRILNPLSSLRCPIE